MSDDIGQYSKDQSPREQIIACIARAGQELGKAGLIALQANKLAPSVPVIQELGKITLRLNTMLQEINKLQGL